MSFKKFDPLKELVLFVIHETQLTVFFLLCNFCVTILSSQKLRRRRDSALDQERHLFQKNHAIIIKGTF